MVTAFYKVFNEADFLNESLTTIYPYADKIVILEYCLESMRKIVLDSRVTDRGLSTDGTTQIIRDFPDPDHKIEHRPMGFVWGGENLIYQYMIDDINVGDYMWVIDGDIVYPPEFAKQIKDWCDNNTYDVIWLCEHVFWHDLSHIKKNFFVHHQRVLKKQRQETFYFAGLFEAKWVWDPGWRIAFYQREENLEEYPYEDKKYNRKVCDESKGEFAYHYSYVRTVQRVLEKVLWQYNMIDYKWGGLPARQHCMNFKNPLDFKLNTMDWFTAGEPQHYERWDRGHPEIMKNNKWAKYCWDEKPINVSYEECLKMIKSVGVC